MYPRTAIAHCNRCGTALQYAEPPDDNRPRAWCRACGHIQYENPLNVVGTLPVLDDGRILLCRRAIEPRHGYWTLPAGFMEVGETTAEGALRETLEEAGARIELGPLFTMIDLPTVEQVHIFYRARLLDLDFAAGTESLEVRLFTEAEIPWRDLAFRTVDATLKLYLEDRARGCFGTHTRALRHGGHAPGPGPGDA
jgi:ADP-ribose pyrophosphatase YjhB (NUDIX family)